MINVRMVISYKMFCRGLGKQLGKLLNSARRKWLNGFIEKEV